MSSSNRYASNAAVGQDCEACGAPIRAHAQSTEEVARDMPRHNAAVREVARHYAGISKLLCW